MLNEIEREKKRAEHLLYVSLKYTKTCDVILNLMERWQHMIKLCIELLFRQAKKRRIIKSVPSAPKVREEQIMKLFKDELVQKTVRLYNFFRRVPPLEKMKEHEFRKNVTLRIIDYGREIEINMDKLKEWNELIESFLKYVRHVEKGKAPRKRARKKKK
jgi:hypothetical protein